MSELKLPPDPGKMNERRTLWGENAIDQLMGDTNTDRPDALSDLLCDLMHWADREDGIDFEAELERAREAYASETAEEIDMTRNYHVKWEIDIDADSPEEAARQARRFQLDEGALVGYFTVAWNNAQGTCVEKDVDLDILDADESA